MKRHIAAIGILLPLALALLAPREAAAQLIPGQELAYVYPGQYLSGTQLGLKNGTSQPIAAQARGDTKWTTIQPGQEALFQVSSNTSYTYAITSLDSKGSPVYPPNTTLTAKAGVVYTFGGPNKVTSPPLYSSDIAGYRAELDRVERYYNACGDKSLDFDDWLVQSGTKAANGATCPAPTTTATAPVTEGRQYFVTSKLNSRVVAIPGASQSANTVTIMWDNDGSLHEQFSFVPAGGGYYYLVFRHSGQALAATGTANDAPVVQLPLQGLDEATLDRFRWQVQPAADGYFYLVLKAGGRVLTIDRGTATNGARLVMYGNAQQLHQLWRFAPAG